MASPRSGTESSLRSGFSQRAGRPRWGKSGRFAILFRRRDSNPSPQQETKRLVIVYIRIHRHSRMQHGADDATTDSVWAEHRCTLSVACIFSRPCVNNAWGMVMAWALTSDGDGMGMLLSPEQPQLQHRPAVPCVCSGTLAAPVDWGTAAGGKRGGEGGEQPGGAGRTGRVQRCLDSPAFDGGRRAGRLGCGWNAGGQPPRASSCCWCLLVLCRRLAAS